MNDVKLWYQSKGIWGSLIAAFGGLWTIIQAIHAFVDANPGIGSGLSEVIGALTTNPAGLITVVGAFLAWYGRWKATTQVSNKPL